MLCPMGQWFGGRCVPMTGVAMVCVAPEHRAGGVGSEMMRAALRELHGRRVPLSALYAATVPLYRRVGYEAAGGRYEITLPANTIGLRDRELSMRRAGPEDADALHQAYRRRVAHESGPLDQQAPAWQRAQQAGRTPQNPAPLTYAAWNGRRVEGYLRYPVKREDRTLRLADFVAATPAAARRLLTFLADHRSTVETVVWHGGPAEPALLALPEHGYRMRLAAPWMLRVVDVAGALEVRGYPLGVSATLAFRVEDELFARNRGPFVLEVAGGKGAVRRGGRGGVRIDVRGLAPLYTGHLSAHQLALTGCLRVTPAEIEVLRAIFAGPAPWMSDAF
jgi:predicted acetyltransferase